MTTHDKLRRVARDLYEALPEGSPMTERVEHLWRNLGWALSQHAPGDVEWAAREKAEAERDALREALKLVAMGWGWWNADSPPVAHEISGSPVVDALLDEVRAWADARWPGRNEESHDHE